MKDEKRQRGSENPRVLLRQRYPIAAPRAMEAPLKGDRLTCKAWNARRKGDALHDDAIVQQ